LSHSGISTFTLFTASLAAPQLGKHKISSHGDEWIEQQKDKNTDDIINKITIVKPLRSILMDITVTHRGVEEKNKSKFDSLVVADSSVRLVSLEQGEGIDDQGNDLIDNNDTNNNTI
jgi:hypothetical protein